MSAHVVCITSGAGLPVFTRKKGTTETLPFSLIGSLNGVHMFAKSQRLELLNSLMQDHCAVWKEFHESIILIGISSGCTVQVLSKLLESAFSAMVLIVGLDEIKSQRNAERLKRELRICYPVVDRLLDSLDCGDATNKHSSDLVMMTETILCSENHLIQIVLESYTECVDSVYSCVLIHGKIAVATESWWSLHPEEIKLLSILATIENTSVSKDIPVFLPHKSPNIAYRFVACMLIPNVQVCCLCGPTPLLEEIEHSAAQCFKSTLEILESAVQCHPRNFSNSLQLEPGILGILLINTKLGKYMMSRSPNSSSNKHASSVSHRLDILRTFFYQAVMIMIDSEDEGSSGVGNRKEQDMERAKKVDKREDKGIRKIGRKETTVSKETYWCSEYHKCHAAVVDDNVLCVLFNSTIPTHSMRMITAKTLKILTTDKQLCWSL